MSSTIDNPFTTGDKVRIPAGAVVRTSSSIPDKVITRAQTITVESALPGYTMDMTSTEGHIMLPEITGLRNLLADHGVSACQRRSS